MENAKGPADIDAGLSPQRKADGLNRVIRSALVGSNGSVEELKRFAADIKSGDFRDVIVYGEYAGGDRERVLQYANGEHISPLYDLKKPFDKDSKPVPART